jgi:hypothetical protein
MTSPTVTHTRARLARAKLAVDRRFALTWCSIAQRSIRFCGLTWTRLQWWVSVLRFQPVQLIGCPGGFRRLGQCGGELLRLFEGESSRLVCPSAN